MYSSVPNSDEKSASGPMIAQDSTKTGTPVNKTNQFYSSKNSRSSSPLQSKNKEPWSTGLCDCFSDCPNCCMTLWCPCVTFAQIADIVDQGSSSYGVNVALYTLMLCVTGNACWYSCFYRGEIRELYALKESPCEDCLVHCFCEYCALCQEYRELKTRGYDLSIGWHGNAEKKNRSLEMASEAPPIEGAMSR